MFIKSYKCLREKAKDLLRRFCKTSSSVVTMKRSFVLGTDKEYRKINSIKDNKVMDLSETLLGCSESKESVIEKPFTVSVIGSGSWGTTIAKVVCENTLLRQNLFKERVYMWVYEEEVNGEKLTEIINKSHENIRYLPGIKLPRNLVANASITDTVREADILIFNIPHQFLPHIVEELKGHIKPGTRAISCLKGFHVDQNGISLLSTYIEEHLNIKCGALSGANLAPEVAKEKWSETTVAYKIPRNFRGVGKDVDHIILKCLFHRPYFHVSVIEDVSGVSVAGALKNVVALACGFVEGLDWGNNAAAAIQRIGLGEMMKFGVMFFPESKVETYYQESAGVADLITTCSGGRNVRIGREMVKTGKSATELEKELLNGQSAQGIFTTGEVYKWLDRCGKLHEFPLFEAVYKIVYDGESFEKLPTMLEDLQGM